MLSKEMTDVRSRSVIPADLRKAEEEPVDSCGDW